MLIEDWCGGPLFTGLTLWYELFRLLIHGGFPARLVLPLGLVAGVKQVEKAYCFEVVDGWIYTTLLFKCDI